MESAPDLTEKNTTTTKKPSIFDYLFALCILNWSIFFAVSMYIGGDAVGTVPSRDGFIVKSHGHRTKVSERVWLCSLFHSTATLLLTIPVFLAFAFRTMRDTKRTGEPCGFRVLIAGFLLIWAIVGYSTIGGRFLRSIDDWRQIKPHACIHDKKLIIS